MTLAEKEIHYWIREDNESPEEAKKRALTSDFGFQYEDVKQAIAELKKIGMEKAKPFGRGKTTNVVIYMLTSKDLQEIFGEELL